MKSYVSETLYYDPHIIEYFESMINLKNIELIFFAYNELTAKIIDVLISRAKTLESISI